MSRPMTKRFAVCVHSYSLEAGHVGEDERQTYVSQHASLKAAKRRLGSLIRNTDARWNHAFDDRPMRGRKFRIWDDRTATWLTWTDARNLIEEGAL